MITRGSVISSLIWKFLERSSVQLVNFILTIVLARILTPEDYGLIALVVVFINLASVFVEGGLNTALVQKKKVDQLDFSTIFYTSIAFAISLYVILFFCAPVISSFYDNESLISVVRILGLSLVLYAINSVQKAFLTKKLLFKKLFYSSLGAVVISGCIGIIMALQDCGVWALVTQSIVSQFSVTIIMWYTVKWRPTLEFSIERFIGLFDFGWKIFASNLLTTTFQNVRSLIIGKIYSAESLAFFDRGKQFPSLIVDNINSSIQSVLFPVLSESQDNRDTVKAMIRRSIKTSSLIIFPIIFGIAILAEPSVKFLLTDKWLGAVPFIQIFCMAYLFMPMQIANLEAIKSLGYSGTSLKLELIKKCFELAILLITIPISVQAIAWGIVVYNGLCLFINAKPNRKLLNYGVKEQVQDIIPNLGVSFLMGLVLRALLFIPISSGYALVIGVIVGIVVYIGLNMLFKVEAFYYIMEMVGPKLKRYYRQ